MNLFKIDLKVIAIALLVIIVLFQNFGGGKKETGDTIKIDGKKYEILKHTVDTVEIVKNKTIYKKGKDIYHDTTIYVQLPSQIVDTLSILKNFYSKNVYKDTLQLVDSLGFIFVSDTISQNTILSRKYDYKVKERTINDKMIVKELPKVQVYYGPIVGIDKVQVLNSIGGGILLKTKKDKIYQIGLGLMKNSGVEPTQVFMNGGIFWKIKVK